MNDEEASGINSSLADFLHGMRMYTQSFVCGDVGERMRGPQPVCGQLWTHEDRQMSGLVSLWRTSEIHVKRLLFLALLMR
jgi:hypothetical protein